MGEAISLKQTDQIGRQRPLQTLWRGFVVLLLILCALIPFHEQLSIEWAPLKAFSITFVSIVLEAMPFVIIGAIIGGLIEVFVSAETLSKIMPRKGIFMVLIPALGGLVLPVCECAVVPVMRRLLKKGMPFQAALAYLLAAPIVNPLVLTSTAVAYLGDDHRMLLWRGIGGYGVAVLAALILGRLIKGELTVKPETSGNAGADHDHSHSHSHDVGCDHDHSHSHSHDVGSDHDHSHSHSHDVGSDHEHAHSHDHTHAHSHNHSQSLRGRLVDSMSHAADDFLMVGMYLVIGSLIASVIHTGLNRDFLVNLSGSPFIATSMMMLMALGLNLCSEADAFVAASFRHLLPFASQLAFLVLGPMMDLKLAAMYLSFMTRRGMILSVLVICTVVGLLATIAQLAV